MNDLDRHIGKWYGKYLGIVKVNERDEKLGWLDVEVPSLFPSPQTVCARPCLPPGHFWVPPVGAKVWVEFEGGNPSSALWVGVFYGDGDVPAEGAKNPPSSRVVHTPSGHVVEFADEDGKQRIVIRHAENAFIAIDENGSIVLSSKTGATLYLNSKDDQAAMMSPQGHSITLSEDTISVVHESGTTVELSDGKVQVVAGAIDLLGSATIPGGALLGTDQVALAKPVVVMSEALILWLMTHTPP
ncbi:MAG: hypothetical protein H0V33_11285, partial [Acidimicrobiia bacterium]|nr:hypothetical protein [Acidimicrobiia bacterium]